MGQKPFWKILVFLHLTEYLAVVFEFCQEFDAFKDWNAT